MPAAHKTARIVEPQRTILVFQGGGALGAYQAGVFEALAESGREPDWVVGTSIGAINAALIAGNPPQKRRARLAEFWSRMSRPESGLAAAWSLPETGLTLGDGFGSSLRSLQTMAFGLAGFFLPRTNAGFAFGLATAPGEASFYDVAPLRETLCELVDFDYLAESPVRLAVGAVDVESARLRYFDSHQCRLGPEHILASGALPPAFPPVEIDGRLYWDGGIYSNTPLEWILRQPRIHTLCLFATLWQQNDQAPQTLRDVLRRSKEIQYASRADSLIAIESELHQLRHAVNLLSYELAELKPESPLRELGRLGCGSVFHLVYLQAPRLSGEDHTKDIEFEIGRVAERRAAGFADTARALHEKPWEKEKVARAEGIVVHDFSAAGGN
ncbi:MAG TPA: patatin-like phospholipase family protein [Azonexus sp.]|nr:patatin-like phospholipase family protein [Azonexus sp.]